MQGRKGRELNGKGDIKIASWCWFSYEECREFRETDDLTNKDEKRSPGCIRKTERWWGIRLTGLICDRVPEFLARPSKPWLWYISVSIW